MGCALSRGPGEIELRAALLTEQPPGVHADDKRALEAIYEECAEFVWLSLQRLGVRKRDLDDLCHDVFLVAQRKLREYDGRSKINTWLFGICVRVAANYRRKAYVRLENGNGAGGIDPETDIAAPEWSQPERAAGDRQRLARVEAILGRMSPVLRVVLLMFEVEGLSCQAIAGELGLPVGTVYSRLYAARKQLLREIEGGKPQGNRGSDE